MIPLFKLVMSPVAPDRIAGVLRSGQFEHGPCDAELGARLDTQRARAVNRGTSGPRLAPSPVAGDRDPAAAPGEVLPTPLTFLAGHRQFHDLDLDRLRDLVAMPCLVFDGRIYFSKETIVRLDELGFRYRGIGR